MTKSPLPSRERVRLALQHKETDRIPFAMVCSGINEPARRDLDNYLRRERRIDLDTFLENIEDIQSVGPRYVGPRRQDGEDIWGVVRKAISYGPASYNEIAHYPLADATEMDDLRKHTWPATALDYYPFP